MTFLAVDDAREFVQNASFNGILGLAHGVSGSNNSDLFIEKLYSSNLISKRQYYVDLTGSSG